MKTQNFCYNLKRKCFNNEKKDVTRLEYGGKNVSSIFFCKYR